MGRALQSSARAATSLGKAVSACPLCASAELVYEFVVDGYAVCGCEHCGLLFLNPQPAVAAAATDPAQITLEPDVYELHAANAASRLQQLMNYAGAGVTRLLVVANDEFLTAEARRRGLQVTTISSAQAACGALDALPEQAFDAAIMYCTLERMQDPAAALAHIRRALAPRGALTVIAPTLDSRTARLFRAGWWEFHRKNLVYFTADTLQSLLIRSGYGDPIIDRDDAAISLAYFRQKLASVPSTAHRRLLRLLATATPAFLRNRAFRRLSSRTVLLVRPKTYPVVPKLSVIVPAYNEKPTFSTLMDRLLAKSIDGVDIEVVLVESNSQDGTREDAIRYGAHPRVRLILQEQPRGKGSAVRAGLAACTGDFVLIQDADLEYDIDDYDDLVQQLRLYRRNFVIGSRHSGQGRGWKIREFNEQTPLASIFNLGHVIFLSLLNWMYQQRLKDPFSMFKVFRRECLYGLTFECNRFDFDFDIVI
jgi:SAM-dependent methyltransferase